MSEAPEDIDAIYAGEYVLGVLNADERARVETRMRDDPAFASLVYFWYENLSPLALEAGTLAPPEALKKRIAATLFSADNRRVRARMRASLAFWRFAAAAMTVLAVIAIAALFYASTRITL